MKISVIGLGCVGSVAAAGLALAQHQVLGIDADASKIDSYRRGELPIYEPDLSNLISTALDRRTLRLQHTSEVVEPLGDVIFITTGTPTNEIGAADLKQVRSAIAWAREKQGGDSTIVMKSTVPPGTGVRLLETVLHGTTFQYIANPEFLREGQAVWDWLHPDRIVIGGTNDQAIQLVQAVYEGIESPYVITDITSAEMIKYAANALLATKISFINEVAELCSSLGATIDDVTTGISLDPRIGPSFLRAGVGYGGSCFPKDVRALDHLALTNGHNLELLRSVITVNNRQRLLPIYTLREHFGRLSGVNIGILGLAFKPHTDDIREAPALDAIRVLLDEGAVVRAFDPKAVPAAKRVLPETVQLVEDLISCAAGAEALVLMTEWPEIVGADWGEVAKYTRSPHLLFDGRNALDPAQLKAYGFHYHGVGRSAYARKTP